MSRRTILTGAAWSLPVIAVAAATPSAAATTTIEVDLTSTARLPREARNGVYLTRNYYQGPRLLTFRATYANLGPDAMPAGSIIQFGLPFGTAWDTNTMTVIEDSSGMIPVAAGSSTVDISAPGGPAALRRVWNFTLSSAVPAGLSFDIIFQVHLNGSSTTATNFYNARVYTNFQVGSSGAHEATLTNNEGFSDSAYFNNANAS